MILDYHPNTGLYSLRVPRGEADPAMLMREHGLDLSHPATTYREACLFTAEEYAAVTFYAHGTPAAKDRLSYIYEQIQTSWAQESQAHIDVPPDRELAPYQKAGVEYAMRREHALIGDEPGTGKTMQAIAIANEMRAKRVLVVCPAVIRFQWIERIKEWSTMNRSFPVPNDTCYPIISSRYGVHDDAAWTVISWDLIRQPALWRALAKTEYDLLILDEAHYAKTGDAKRTRSIFGGGRDAVAAPLTERAAKVVALTGTPLPNRPREAYVLARGLCWEAIDWLSEEDFTERFNPIVENRTKSRKVWVDEREGRLPEFQNRLRANYMVRRLKRDVMPQLKLPVYDLIRVDETEPVKAALQAESLLGIDPDDVETGHFNPKDLGPIATARRQMGVAMAPQVAGWLKMLIDGGESKLTVFAWHIEVLDILCRELDGYAGLGVVRVDGSDSPKRKAEKIHRFIHDPKVGVIIGNVLSLGTGTDGLQAVSSHALIAEPDWVMGNNQQCIDRLDRGGQKARVQAEFFVAPGSISEKVLASALRKGNTVYKALDRRVA